jgi:hypothetical protein
MHLRRSTFVRGLWGTAGIATGSAMVALGAPSTFDFEPFRLALAILASISVGLNCSFITAWIAGSLDRAK